MEMVFYRCEHCGQIVAIVKKTGVPIICWIFVYYLYRKKIFLKV